MYQVELAIGRLAHLGHRSLVKGCCLDKAQVGRGSVRDVGAITHKQVSVGSYKVFFATGLDALGVGGSDAAALFMAGTLAVYHTYRDFVLFLVHGNHAVQDLTNLTTTDGAKHLRTLVVQAPTEGARFGAGESLLQICIRV